MPNPLTAAAAFATVAASNSGSKCPDPHAIQEGARFHSDVVCDRRQFNAFKDALGRASRYQALKAQGTIMNVPDEKTSYCPTDPGAFGKQHAQQSIQTGLDTMWIVENKSSHAVVISYLDAEGNEKSARNPQLASMQDESTQLQPGQWMALHTYQGHSFQAREILPDGSAGPVLMQHRVGLIPIGSSIPPELLVDCPVEDLEPLREDATPDPMYARTPPAQGRPCHTLDVAFRNVAGCPLHGYYVSPAAEDCQETFKFHLGRETTNLPDFMWDWASATKFEGTFVGHAFQFRLAHAPGAWSQLVQLAPTQIVDCPDQQAAVAIGVGGEAEAIAIPRGETLFHNLGSS
jgi:hypothetical protein